MFDVVYSLLQYLILLVDIVIVNFCVPAGHAWHSLLRLRDSCDGFAYSIDAKEGGYVLNITDAVVILTRDKVTGQVVLELT